MTVKPESMGLCSSRPARIDKLLAERYIKPGLLPCAQLQVAHSGKLLTSAILDSKA